jgi:hypothetical protein
MHLGLDFHSELDQAAIETISFLVNCLQIQTSIHDDCGLAFNAGSGVCLQVVSRLWKASRSQWKRRHGGEHGI